LSGVRQPRGSRARPNLRGGTRYGNKEKEFRKEVIRKEVIFVREEVIDKKIIFKKVFG
jgi:hypothetical protein